MTTDPTQAEIEAEMAAEALLYATGLRRLPNNQPLRPHGTIAAYKRHLTNGDPPCTPCREANNADKRGRKANPDRSHKPITHGTTAGRAAHIYRGEQPCEPCIQAYREYSRKRAATRRLSQAPPLTG
jgi:hypothetical protein